MDRRENNKPLLREDLKPALQAKPSTLQRRIYDNGWETSHGTAANDSHAAEVEKSSIHLEKVVLDTVKAEMVSFKTPELKLSLDAMPADDKNAYGERFREQPWKTLLDKVECAFGSDFGSSLTFPMIKKASNKIESQKQLSSITQKICGLVKNIPEVMENPAMSSQQALGDLGASIDRAVVQWALQRCSEEINSSGPNPESENMLRTIEMARDRYASLLDSEVGSVHYALKQ
ncbi:hypothetical protein G7Z17_g1398 [Cylindrodendrum hubeiense]|uniref:Uncharacterized protein n=1 Tax=Cylindrodendrum hubeiense TaxID=595255 RepID=A0A9P5HLN6_9HYPO|nr:hypothetical protein G7Z17_g1398 [Cylindrodendrum hubeiense]